MATLLQIRDRCYQRANRINQTHRFPNSEVNQYINDSYKELWAILVRHSLLRPEAKQSITADGSSSYTLNSDHFATLAVWREHSRDVFQRLRRHTVRDRLFDTNAPTTGDAFTYRIVRESVSGVITKKIEFFPRPSGDDYIVIYVPIPVDLTADTDTLDSVLAWDEYIVNDVAIKMLLRENTDVSQLRTEKSLVLQRIRDEAEMQEMTEAWNIEDSRGISEIRDPADIRWARNGDFCF